MRPAVSITSKTVFLFGKICKEFLLSAITLSSLYNFMTHEQLHEHLSRAAAENSKGTYSEAERLTREVLTFQPLDKDIYFRALSILSDSLWYRGRAKEALPIAEEVLVLAQQAEVRQDLADAFQSIGRLYDSLSEYPRALEYLEKSLVINEELGRKANIASALLNIGIVFENLSDYPRGLEYYLKALAIEEELGEQRSIAQTLGNIGNIYNSISDYPRALEYFQKALSISVEFGMREITARTLSNIGLVYYYLSDFHQALDYFRQSLSLNESLGRQDGIAGNLGNIGIVYDCMQEYSQALEYYHKALSIGEKLGRKNSIAQTLGNIGIAYVNLSDNSQALEYTLRALAINEELGRKDGIANNLLTIGSVYKIKLFEGYSTEKAEEYLLKAIEVSQEIGVKHIVYECYQALSELYEQEGDAVKALHHFKKYHAIEKEVQSEEIKKLAQRATYERQIGEMQREQDVTDRILHNILPKEIALRIRRGDKDIVDSYESVSILFADIVNFTTLTQHVVSHKLVAFLNTTFNTFDVLAEKHGCEKIKTIGDCYMVVAGLPERCDNHAERLALMALDMLKAIEEFPAMVEGVSINMRIGIHSGSVVAGIIGKNKYAYDLWGDAVNTASRMESHGEPGKIHVSEEFTRGLAANTTDTNLHFVPRGELSIKGKGTMNTYFLENSNTAP